MDSKKKTVTADDDDILKSYFRQIRDIPLLSFEEELELSRRIQKGDEDAKKRLIEANLRLVIKIARSYLSSAVSFMDIIQEGNIGLMRAVEKYDWNKNVRFSTYANWWIHQAIARFISNRCRVIRLPHRKEETLRKIRKAYHLLSQTLQHEPGSEEIARYMHMEKEDVEYIMNISTGLISLEADLGNDEGATMVDLCEDYTWNPERALLRKSSRKMTRRFLSRLKDRERRILVYRYQLDGGEKQTLKTIGDEMGISPETVRQIELRAIKKMKANAGEIRGSVYMEAM
ncbi:MAG: RNA polymerase sigma factor RpoD/SigA [Spirochaetaceae bacterium]|jgi:RNA polymerase primary sigma factor|nr:RNA polymerase sigma factor RpoD/SigA [Spirochaetaceae bacterium]